jgi:hypothetical protein
MLISNLFKKLLTKEFTEKVGGPRTSADKADKTKDENLNKIPTLFD